MNEKELAVAESDLAAAAGSLKRADHKWATVQGYYSICHAARALLFARGYGEKSHRGLQAMLRDLHSNEIPQQMFDDFRDAMILRESADYGLVSSVEGAEDVLGRAEEFLKKAKALLRERSVSRKRRLRSG
jgi:uncharacterized protein (UPF0332 family)